MAAHAARSDYATQLRLASERYCLDAGIYYVAEAMAVVCAECEHRDTCCMTECDKTRAAGRKEGELDNGC